MWPSGTTERVAVDGGHAVALHDCGGPDRAPVVLFCHANGFASRSYAGLLGALASRLRVYAMDLRGHGESSPLQPPFASRLSADLLARDFATVAALLAARHGGRAPFAMAHSLGALLPLWSMLEGLVSLQGAVLFDAAVFPPTGHAVHEEAAALNTQRRERTPTRRREFESPQALAKVLGGLPAFASLSQAALLAHCEAVLSRAAAWQYVLRCHPEAEAFLYAEMERASPYNALGRLRSPVLLAGADPGNPGSSWVGRMQPDLAARIAGAKLVVLPGTGHLLPLEAPDHCADLAAGWILERS